MINQRTPSPLNVFMTQDAFSITRLDGKVILMYKTTGPGPTTFDPPTTMAGAGTFPSLGDALCGVAGAAACEVSKEDSQAVKREGSRMGWWRLIFPTTLETA